MAVNRTDGGVGGVGRIPGGGAVIRPLYGDFIHDEVEKYRTMINVTLSDLKQGIRNGDPKGKVVQRDGILQGSELTKAKKAAKELNEAVKALKPVFGSRHNFNTQAARNELGRPGGGGAIALYGVVLRHDLARYRDGIKSDMATIKAGIKSGELTGKAKTEATAALRELNDALKALGRVPAF